MKLKTLASVIAAGFALAAVDTASACNYSLWVPDSGSGTINTGGVATDTTGTPATATLVAGRPNLAAQPVNRISGLCGSLSKAPGNYVVDGSPTDEVTFRFRFYIFTGTTGATNVVYRAREASAGDIITVSYTGSAFNFAIAGGGTATTPAVANRWYSIEGNWAQGQQMQVTVTGNTGNAPVATPVNLTTAGGTPSASANIDSAELGWISGGADGNGDITTDAYEARRTNPIGRLLRGDSTGNASITIGDATAVVTEVNGGALVTGQGECNESGGVTIGDATCIVGIVNN